MDQRIPFLYAFVGVRIIDVPYQTLFALFASIVGPLISSANKERRKMMKVIAPVVDERREMLAKFGNEWTDRPVSIFHPGIQPSLNTKLRMTTSCALLNLPTMISKHHIQDLPPAFCNLHLPHSIHLGMYVFIFTHFRQLVSSHCHHSSQGCITPPSRSCRFLFTHH